MKGTININGDWYNNSENSFVTGSTYNIGTVNFQGVNMQYIDGIYEAQFNNISVENTAGLSLNQDVKIHNLLELQQSKLVKLYTFQFYWRVIIS